ncbi:MAG: hypothetical protein ACI9VR_005365 [Cognaticolwellia sp.]
MVGARSGLLLADPAEPWASGVERNIRGSIEG